MRFSLSPVLGCVFMLLVCSHATAQPTEIFYDGFEGPISANWSGWDDVTVPPGCCGPYMLFNSDSHAHEGSLAARQEKAQPWWYGSVHEEAGLASAVSGDVRVSAWQFEDYNKQAPFPPGHPEENPHDQVQGWLALMSSDETEFFAVGVHAHKVSPAPLLDWWGHYSWATTLDGWHTTTVERSQGWHHLEIVLHPYTGDVGDVEFFVDGIKVGEGRRQQGTSCEGVPVTRVGIGASPAHVPEDYIANTYEFFWYDEVEVTTDVAESACPNAELRFDADADGDVDQVDFSVFQVCFGDDIASSCRLDCRCMDSDGDYDVDGDDFIAFEACASGPGVPADETCDD